MLPAAHGGGQDAVESHCWVTREIYTRYRVEVMFLRPIQANMICQCFEYLQESTTDVFQDGGELKWAILGFRM